MLVNRDCWAGQSGKNHTRTGFLFTKHQVDVSEDIFVERCRISSLGYSEGEVINHMHECIYPPGETGKGKCMQGYEALTAGGKGQ